MAPEPPPTVSWHTKTLPELYGLFTTDEKGLRSEEAERRLAQAGPNTLPTQKSKGLIRIFLEQFESPLIYVLIAADVTVFSLQEFTDAFIILFVLLFNAILGTIQEGRAQHTLAALKKFTETNAEVLRNGKEYTIRDEGVVPGDIIILSEGMKIPADARIISAHNVTAGEAALTGESEPVRKVTEVLHDARLSTADQRNMIFKGTAIATGYGKALVVATGIRTVIGGLSQRILAIDTEIPLTRNLRGIARTVVLIVIALIIILFTAGVAEGKPFTEMFVAAVAIAVAAVPEGLPLVLTVVLAFGVSRMAKRRVLVKKLQAVEALGQAQDIAVDKTGTITKNELVIRQVLIGARTYDIPGVGYEPTPRIESPDPDLLLASRIALFCSNAHLARSEDGTGTTVIGDPTEGALAVFAEKTGLRKDALLGEYRMINDWPFDYAKKFHVALYEKNGMPFLAVTGAPEVLLERASERLLDGRIVPFTADEKRTLEAHFLALSGQGLRVIAFAFRDCARRESVPELLPPLVFGGLYAMQDGLRPGIKEAVQKAHTAGIRVMLVTGDHAATARAIAEEAGIYATGDDILTGADIDALPPSIFEERLKRTTVFARVTPEHKLKIIEAYRKRGEIIAMTGDGVNDAPSLMAADLGIAMGRIGTEVTKEAADLVLMDDNFGDILQAVEEGRNMRQGLRRSITYLFSSNLGEIIAIAAALLFREPLPLVAAQIIWMNLVTDTFFDISLAMEPRDTSLMQKNKRPPRSLFDRLITVRLFTIAPVIGIGAFLLFQDATADLVRARTIALTSLVVFQWFNSLNCRSETKSVFSLDPFSNRFLLTTLFLVVGLHFFALYTPVMQRILSLVPLSPSDWQRIILMGASVVAVEEIRKYLVRLRAPAPETP